MNLNLIKHHKKIRGYFTKKYSFLRIKVLLLILTKDNDLKKMLMDDFSGLQETKEVNFFVLHPNEARLRKL